MRFFGVVETKLLLSDPTPTWENIRQSLRRHDDTANSPHSREIAELSKRFENYVRALYDITTRLLLSNPTPSHKDLYRYLLGRNMLSPFINIDDIARFAGSYLTRLRVST